MIKFEHGMLVLNNTFTKEDIEHINAFAGYIRNQEQERIVKLIEGWWDNTEDNPVTLIALIRDAEPKHLKDSDELCDNE
jgi:hypothetical protein